jgi:competence protein ComEA
VEPSSAPWRVLETPDAEEPSAQSDPRTIPWPVVVLALVVATAVLGSVLLGTRPDPEIGVDGATSLAGDVGPASATPGLARDMGAQLVVEVGGAVNHPGVYRLPTGSRIGDAITAAGGYGPRVDATAADSRLNLAAPLHDGDEIHVPSRDEAVASAGPGAAVAGGASQGGGLIDLNSATAAELDTLPGVGPATAAKIIAAREEQRFRSVEDLQARKVVGTSTFEKIRSLVTAGP